MCGSLKGGQYIKLAATHWGVVCTPFERLPVFGRPCKVERVSFNYTHQASALDRGPARIESGRLNALLGPTGAGKRHADGTGSDHITGLQTQGDIGSWPACPCAGNPGSVAAASEVGVSSKHAWT